MVGEFWQWESVDFLDTTATVGTGIEEACKTWVKAFDKQTPASIAANLEKTKAALRAMEVLEIALKAAVEKVKASYSGITKEQIGSHSKLASTGTTVIKQWRDEAAKWKTRIAEAQKSKPWLKVAKPTDNVFHYKKDKPNAQCVKRMSGALKNKYKKNEANDKTVENLLNQSANQQEFFKKVVEEFELESKLDALKKDVDFSLDGDDVKK